MTHPMNLFEQFRRAEETISETGQEFTLFGLCERDDVPGKFDVIVSARWLTGSRLSLNLIAELVRQAIGNDNWWPRIGKFVVLPENDPLVKAVLSRMPSDPVMHDLRVLNDLPYEGEIIRNAVIITADRQPDERRRLDPVAA